MHTSAKTASLYIGLALAFLALVTTSFKVTVWAADQRYVTQQSLRSNNTVRQLQGIESEMNRIQLRIQYGEATRADKARYEQLKLLHARLLKELNG